MNEEHVKSATEVATKRVIRVGAGYALLVWGLFTFVTVGLGAMVVTGLDEQLGQAGGAVLLGLVVAGGVWLIRQNGKKVAAQREP